MSLENLLWSVTEAIFRHNDPYQPDYPQERLFQVVERLFRHHMVEANRGTSRAGKQGHPQTSSPGRLQSSGGYLCSVRPASRSEQVRLTPRCVDGGRGSLSDIYEYKEGRQGAVPLNGAMKLTRLVGPGGLRSSRVRRLNPPPICLRLVHASEAAG